METSTTKGDKKMYKVQRRDFKNIAVYVPPENDLKHFTEAQRDLMAKIKTNERIRE